MVVELFRGGVLLCIVKINVWLMFVVCWLILRLLGFVV